MRNAESIDDLLVALKATASDFSWDQSLNPCLGHVLFFYWRSTDGQYHDARQRFNLCKNLGPGAPRYPHSRLAPFG